MTKPTKRTADTPAQQSLITLAMLKAHFDHDRDYLSMFLPFVEEIIYAAQESTITNSVVGDRMRSQFDLNLPVETLQTLLRRLCKRGILKASGGIYSILSEGIRPSRIKQSAQNLGQRFNRLAEDLCEYASQHGYEFDSSADALDALLQFFDAYKVEVLLEREMGHRSAPMHDDRAMRVAALYITDRRSVGGETRQFIEDLAVGVALRDAMFFRNPATPKRKMNGLQIFCDSGFLLGLLGLKGRELSTSNRSLLQLLKSLGAHTSIFEPTLGEMTGIISGYERVLRQPSSVREMRPGLMTDYVVTQRLTASDIRDIVSTLRHRLEYEFGFHIRELPDHRSDTTLDETRLAEMLRGDDPTPESPRVRHDVDCVAGVLTLRRGAVLSELADARAVFMTDAGSVANTIKTWYREMDEVGVLPVIHQVELSNRAWLMAPDVSPELKVHELAALCAAASRPSDATWDTFLNHLERMVDEGRLSSVESVHVAIEAFRMDSLVELEIHDEMDAAGLDQVVKRVRAEDRREFREVENELRGEITGLRGEVEEYRAREARQETRREAIAHVTGVAASWLMFLALSFMVGVAIFVGVGAISGVPRWLDYASASVAAVVSFVATLRGDHLGRWRTAMYRAVHRGGEFSDSATSGVSIPERATARVGLACQRIDSERCDVDSRHSGEHPVVIGYRKMGSGN